MKRRLCLLGFLLVALTAISIIEPVQPASADESSCQACESAQANCYVGCEGQYDWCMSDGYPQYICNELRQSCQGQCDFAHSQCVNANCGPGGYGGGGCVEGKAYQSSCIMNYCPMLADCKTGGVGFDGGCQGLTGDDLERCCNAAYEVNMINNQLCDCNPYNDPHHHCVCSPSCPPQ